MVDPFPAEAIIALADQTAAEAGMTMTNAEYAAMEYRQRRFLHECRVDQLLIDMQVDRLVAALKDLMGPGWTTVVEFVDPEHFDVWLRLQ